MYKSAKCMCCFTSTELNIAMVLSYKVGKSS